MVVHPSSHGDSWCPVVLWIRTARSRFRLRGSHPLWRAFPDPSANVIFTSCPSKTPAVSLLPVWPLPRSLATTYGISFDFFSSAYLDVSVQQVPSSVPICFSTGCTGVPPCGFPHSDIRGSMAICASPRLFAACHVLRRLPVPRHPPCALSCLTFLSGRAQTLFAGFLPQLVSFFPFEFARILVRQLPAFQLNCFPQFPFTCFPYCCLLKFVSSLFSSQGTIAFSAEASASPLSAPSPAPAGYGLKWTRTTDLALIRRAL